MQRCQATDRKGVEKGRGSRTKEHSLRMGEMKTLMNQGAGQRTDVGCHWSGSESGEEADEGHSEAEDGNGWETLGVQSDTEETGSRVEDGQAEEVGETSKGGSGGGSEETRETEGLSGQGRVWKDWWQRSRNRKWVQEWEMRTRTLRRGKCQEQGCGEEMVLRTGKQW